MHDGAVHRCERDRVGARLGLVAVRRRPGHVDEAGDQPAVARSRRVVAGRKLGELRRARRAARRSIDSRVDRHAHDSGELPLRRDVASDGTYRTHRPECRTLHRFVRDRHAQFQTRRHRRTGVQRRIAEPEQHARPGLHHAGLRRAELRLLRRKAVAYSVLRPTLLPAGAPDGRVGPVRAGRVDDPTRHAQSGSAIRLHQHGLSGCGSAGRTFHAGASRGRTERRPGLERHQSARRHLVGCTRKRQNRGQSLGGALQPAESQRYDAPFPSVQLVDLVSIPQLD